MEPNPRKKKRFNEKDIEELRRKLEGSLSDVCELNIKNFATSMISKSELAKLMSVSVEDMEESIEELSEQKIVYVFNQKKDSFLWHAESEGACRKKILDELS